MIGFRALKRLGLLAALSLCLGVSGSLLVASSVNAAGEVFTWKDYRTISVTGPDLKGTSTLLLQDTPQTGDGLATFGGNLLYNKGGSKGCRIDIQLKFFKSSGTGGARVWNPPPYDSAEVGSQNSTPRCYLVGQKGLDPAIHNQWVAVGGTRPTDPNAPERDEEKRVSVSIDAPDPLSTAPQTVTVTIKKADGTVVGTQTVPFTNDSGAAEWPPDQTPVSARAEFSLEPGDYLACDNYVIKNCEKFTKKKYDFLLLRYGSQFQTPDKKQITGNIEYHTKRPCGSSLTVDPITIQLKLPDGTTISKKTDSGASNARPNESGQLCTVDVTLGMTAIFDNMPPGDYEACAANADSCVKFTKKDGEGASFTLIIRDEDPAPPDQKVCTSGEGVAGALAWIICPLTQIIASATTFFEENIIVPFMTISPLTTNNSNPVYNLWRTFRDIANIGFIILLFISIFSIALSKYNLKRVLPRLLVVAIGINLSYFAIALVIDAFNIFGAGVSQLITAALQQAGTTQLTEAGKSASVGSMFALGGAALLTILLTGGAAIGWLFSLLGLAALVVVVVVIVLVVRQIAIIVLVVLAPIAILMYMLPNTEGYFTKWRQLLVQLLMMYPMIVLLFAAGKIFGIILQQPDFKIGGDGVTNEVGDAVRVILQFVVYVIPLAFLPATFAASGALMGRLYGALNGALLKRRAQNLREDASRLGGEARLRVANSRVPGLNRLAGASLRSNYTREQRGRNLQRAQEDYTASAVGGSSWMRRRAAGVAGQQGQTRAAAFAANTATRGRNEDIDNEKALLNSEMRRIGMDETSFAAAVGEYLSAPNDPSKRVITGANGQSFDFKANETRLKRALLDSAAAQGDIRAVEAARMSRTTDQNMVDDIIRRNDGALKGKGGYHLATQFGLAATRMQVRDPGTGALRAPANDAEVKNEMLAQRLIAMSQTGANSIAGMKTSMMMDTAQILRTPGPERDALLRTIDQHGAAQSTPKDYRAMLRKQLDQVLDPTNRNTLARSDTSEDDFKAIRNNI